MYFEIYQESAGLSTLSGQWRWRLKSDNNRIVASGESYHNKEDCLHAIAIVKGTNEATPIREPDNIFAQSGLLGAIAKELQKPQK